MAKSINCVLFLNRLEYPFISFEEEDEPKSSTSEVFKAVIDNDHEYLQVLIQVCLTDIVNAFLMTLNPTP